MTEDIVAISALTILGLWVTVAVGGWVHDRGPVLLGFLLRLGIGLGIYLAGGLVAPDAIGYDQDAMTLVCYWSGDCVDQPDLSAGKEGFTWLLAAIYNFVGHQPALGIILNVTIASITTAVVMDTCRRLGWIHGAHAAGWLMLFPAFLLWPSLLLRESLAWLTTVVAVWAAVGLAQRVRGRDVFWLVASLAVAMTVRGSVAVMVALGLAVGIVLARRHAGVLALTVIGIAFLGTTGPLMARVNAVTGMGDLAHLNRARESLGTATSGFTTEDYEGISSFADGILNVLPRVLFGPFPQELISLSPIYAADLAAWLAILVLAGLGWRAIESRIRWVILAPVAALLIALAMQSGNYGTMIRLRSQAGVMLVVLAAAWFEHRHPRSDNEDVTEEGVPVGVPGSPG